MIVLWNLSPPSPASTTPEGGETSTFDKTKTASLNPIIPLTLFAFLSLSRVGHYMIHLMVQELGQVEIPASQRSTFAGTEQSFNSLFALCHWAATVVWSRPEQFRMLALGSALVIGGAVCVFGSWARRPVRKVQKYESIAMSDVQQGVEDEEDRTSRRD